MADVLETPSHAYEDILDDILNDSFLDEKFPELRDAFQDARDHPPSFSGPPEDVGGGSRGGFRDFLPDPDKISKRVFQWSAEYFVRVFLNYLRNHDDDVFNKAYDLLDPELQEKLTMFLDGKSINELFKKNEEVFNIPASQASREKFLKLGHEVDKRRAGGSRGLTSRGDDIGVSSVPNDPFTNWGETVNNKPSITWVAPTKISQLCEIVKSAKAEGKRVRAAGYRHSWSSIYSADNQVLVSILDQHLVETLPNCTSLAIETPDYGDNDFKIIQPLGAIPGKPGKGLVKIGAAVTNEDFRRWAVKNNTWTLPINVIMVEITFGGSNAPICHGAGIKTQTLSDLVREIEYVDCNGVLRQISDPKQLQAAAGCFGLLGIVATMTLEVDKMIYAELNPQYKDLLLAIPPPPGFKLPAQLQSRYDELKKQPGVLDQALKDFIDTAENCYYAEWFWFPTQTEAFINAWNTTESSTGVIDYPSKLGTFAEWLSSWAGEVVQNSLFSSKLTTWFFTPARQAAIMSTMAMGTLPKDKVTTYLIDALHFRRGIQNMRVGDFEVEIPIPPTTPSGNTRDWRLVQQAWWDGIAAMYADPNYSARIALEMRVTHDSNILLAPQHGNTLGTASIEVITSMPAVRDDRGIWPGFKQTLADKWLAYVGPDGNKLNVRPHFAKEWTDTKVNPGGKSWVQHLKEKSMTKEIGEFKSVLAEIGKGQGWTVKDLQNTFSTPLLDDLIFSA